MKFAPLRTPVNRTAWLLAVGVGLAGYVGVDGHYERAIARADTASAQYLRRADAYRHVLARTHSLKDVKRRAELELARSATFVSPSDRLFRLLAVLDVLSRRCGVRLSTVTPGEDGRSGNDGLISAPLQLRLSGSFSAVVRFIDLLPRAGEPIEITDVRLTVANTHASSRPSIAADVTAQLYRLTDPEVPHATGAR